jgi:hypothetical protein
LEKVEEGLLEKKFEEPPAHPLILFNYHGLYIVLIFSSGNLRIEAMSLLSGVFTMTVCLCGT